MRGRVVLGAVGVLVTAYGAFLLLSRQDLGQLVGAAVWLASGVVLHDFVLAPVVIGLVGAGALVTPDRARVPVVAGLVVLGSTTLLAIPVLGRFGARADNATLLDRDYGAGWLAFAGLVLLAVVVSTLLRARRR